MNTQMDLEMELVKKLYVNNGEYDFSNDIQANRFTLDLLHRIQNSYTSEEHCHRYKTLEEFIYSHHADSEAYWLYEDNYSN